MHGTYTFLIFPPIFWLCGWFCSCYGEGRSEWGCKFSATEAEITAPRCRMHHLCALCPCRRIGLALASCPAGLTLREGCSMCNWKPTQRTRFSPFYFSLAWSLSFSDATTGWEDTRMNFPSGPFLLHVGVWFLLFYLCASIFNFFLHGYEGGKA